MALSLPGERSLAAGSRFAPIRAFGAWFTRAKAARNRRVALTALLELDHSRLQDLGIDRGDIAEALAARNGRTPGMVLNAARAKSARP